MRTGQNRCSLAYNDAAVTCSFVAFLNGCDLSMEPVIEEEGSKRSAHDAVSPRHGTDGGGKRPLPFTRRSKMDSRDLHPSIKYPEIEGVNQVTLRHAHAPPKPTLPRRPGVKTWTATAKERNPLIASLTGPGRAGKQAELLGDAGGLYQGEVLAGRPHGYGSYLASKSPGSTQRVLQYEGDWIQGRREGMGTRYYPNGEQYTGQFVANIRHGTGRYTFENGDIYVGQWLDDRRTGRGTYFYANGNIFVGNFVRGRKEGLGTLYMVSHLRKYIAEYVNNSPQCGSMLALEDAELQPLQGQLVTLALSARLDMAATGKHVSPIPALELKQPNKVLAGQVVDVRHTRANSGRPTLKAAQESSGTLSHRDLEMLRHSFTLMAGGDDLAAGLLPHQLRELCVMAGLDPAAPVTRALVEQLLEHRQPRTGRIGFDDLMKVAVHFKDQDEDDLLQQHTLLLQSPDEDFSAIELGVDQGTSVAAAPVEDSELIASPSSTPMTASMPIDPSANLMESTMQPTLPFLQSLVPAPPDLDGLIATELDTAGSSSPAGFGSRHGSMHRPSSARPMSARSTSARPTSALNSRPSSRRGEDAIHQQGSDNTPSLAVFQRGSDTGSTRQGSIKVHEEQQPTQQGNGNQEPTKPEEVQMQAESSTAASYQVESKPSTPSIVPPLTTSHADAQQRGAVTEEAGDDATVNHQQDITQLGSDADVAPAVDNGRRPSEDRPASAGVVRPASAAASRPSSRASVKHPSITDALPLPASGSRPTFALARQSSSTSADRARHSECEQGRPASITEDDVLFASLAAPLQAAAAEDDLTEALADSQGRQASATDRNVGRPVSAGVQRSSRPASAVHLAAAAAAAEVHGAAAENAKRQGSGQEIAAETADVPTTDVALLDESTLADAPAAEQADDEVTPLHVSSVQQHEALLGTTETADDNARLPNDITDEISAGASVE